MRSSLTRLVRFVVMAACATTLSAGLLAADPVTREAISSLSPEEKTALLQKKERFDSLPAAEQERLRKLNAEISSSEQSEQLQATLDRYHEWLKTLSTKQRADLLELPMEKRIDRIKELMKEQERSRLRDLGGKQLPEVDVDAIFNWLEEFMKQHEEEYLNRVYKDYAEKLRSQDDVTRRRSLMRGIIMRGPRSDFPLPMRDDFERLLPALSPATRKAFEEFKTPEDKQRGARQWIFSAMVSKVLPPASEEDLHKILDSLSDNERERLERKSPEEVKRELTWRFHWQQWPGREGGFRGGPGSFGGPGSGGFRPPGGGGPGQGSGGTPDRRGPSGGPPSKRPPGEEPGREPRTDRPSTPPPPPAEVQKSP